MLSRSIERKIRFLYLQLWPWRQFVYGVFASRDTRVSPPLSPPLSLYLSPPPSPLPLPLPLPLPNSNSNVLLFLSAVLENFCCRFLPAGVFCCRFKQATFLLSSELSCVIHSSIFRLWFGCEALTTRDFCDRIVADILYLSSSLVSVQSGKPIHYQL